MRFPAIVGIIGTVGIVLLLGGAAPLIGAVLLLPFVLQQILVAFDTGSARVAAEHAMRLRSKGDRDVITAADARNWARIGLVIVVAVIAIGQL